MLTLNFCGITARSTEVVLFGFTLFRLVNIKTSILIQFAGNILLQKAIGFR